MYKKEKNYAFIDAQNIYRGSKEKGLIIDWKKFRVYLKEKYSTTKAYLFIGYIESNLKFYNFLEQSDFILIFKPTTFDPIRGIKGNCDGDMILHTMIELNNFDYAIIVTGDGDFYSLVRYLYEEDKLKAVFCPNLFKCSRLLRNEAKEKIKDLSEIQNIYRIK